MVLMEQWMKLNVWFDQGKEFYNHFMQKLLDKNAILMYLTQNKGKSVIAEMFIKCKIYEKKAPPNGSNSDLGELNEYNNTDE